MKKTIIKTTTVWLLTAIAIFSSVIVVGAEVVSSEPTEAPTAIETQAPTVVPTETPTEVVDPSVPLINSTENTRSGIKVKWNKVDDAVKYRVFVKSGSKWKKLSDTKKTYFTYESVQNNTEYTFTVRCVSSNGKKYTSSYDKEGFNTTYYAVPKLSKATNTTDGVKVTWKAVDGIDSYRVYVKRSGAKKWTNKGIVNDTSFTHTSGLSGRKYCYTVRCVKDKKVVSSFDKNGKTITYVATPIVNKLENTRTGTKLTWDKCDGAYKYRVFIKSGNKWKKLDDTTKAYFTYEGAQNNTEYTYTVRCCDKNGKYVSAYNKEGFTSTFYKVPQLNEVKNTTDGIKVTWKAVDGIDEYRLYVKSSGSSWTKVADVSDTTYTDTNVLSGIKYTYTVKCTKNNKTVSSFNSKGKSITYIAAPVITSATLDKNNNVKLTWDKCDGAYKYRVFVKSDSGWKGVLYTTGTTYTVKNPKDNTTYSYTVRCCDSKGNYISDFIRDNCSFTRDYVIEQEAYTEENLLYENIARAICNKCGKDITDNITDISSPYYGMSGYQYHILVDNCQSAWHGETRWFDVATGLEATEQQKSDANNIYLYNETHDDRLEYRFHYSALCYVDNCMYGGVILASKDTFNYDDTVESEMQSILEAHKEKHRANNERTDGVVGCVRQIYQIIDHPEISHYELIVK